MIYYVILGTLVFGAMGLGMYLGVRDVQRRRDKDSGEGRGRLG